MYNSHIHTHSRKTTQKRFDRESNNSKKNGSDGLQRFLQRIATLKMFDIGTAIINIDT